MRNAPWALVLALCLLTVGRGEAMQMELTRSELCSVSAAVVVADVADVEASWAAGTDGAIERRVQLDIRQTLRGTQRGSLEIILPGGRIGEVWTWVEDVPALQAGRTYLLFLDETPTGWQVIGGDAGAVSITTRSHKGESLKSVLASVEGCDAR